VLLIDDDDELPSRPTEPETKLVAELGEAGLHAIDVALQKQARRGWLKVARVVYDALRAGGFPISDDGYVQLHARRVMALVESGALEAQGNPRRPRWSEVRLPVADRTPGRWE
jgi:hypothetical protein